MFRDSVRSWAKMDFYGFPLAFSRVSTPSYFSLFSCAGLLLEMDAAVHVVLIEGLLSGSIQHSDEESAGIARTLPCD